MTFSQCNTKAFAKNGSNFKSMSEMFWDSTKTRRYSEGVDGYYISTNKSISEYEIVVTHLLMDYSDNNIPNKLTILLPSGLSIIKYAENSSYNTFNFVNKAPNESNSIECNFILTQQEIEQILAENKFESIKIENYKQNKLMIIITNKDIYAGQLSEMFRCVTR